MAMCWERAVLLAFRLCLVILYVVLIVFVPFMFRATENANSMCVLTEERGNLHFRAFYSVRTLQFIFRSFLSINCDNCAKYTA